MEPAEEYRVRRDRFQSEEAALSQLFNTIGNWRLALGVITAVLAWLVFASHLVPAYVLLAPVLVFAALVVWHGRVTRRRTLLSRAVRYYDRGLLRLRDEWMGSGASGERFRSASHVYADDLDLFGKGSLFELISTARTAAGEDVLASWLLKPASREVALERQAAVQELIPNLRLREDLALLAEDVRSDINARAMTEWGLRPAVRFHPFLKTLCLLLAAAGVCAVLTFFAQLIPLWIVAVLAAIDFVIIFRVRPRVTQVLGDVENSGRDLGVLSALLARLEQEQFQSPLLRRLREQMEIEGQPASRRVAQLQRLVDWLDSSDHAIVRVFRSLILFREQLAMSFERWRQHSGAHVGEWVEAVADWEALSSFAALAFERPAWTMPALLGSAEAQLAVTGLRHPLIPAGACIPNDLTLDRTRRLLIVSGSNMSGKSTLLRAVGLNVVLAWAGAPVAADSLAVSSLATGASIRVNDSLQDHRSRFMAEITRIRQIVDLANEGRPVLFLLDEVLSGTNSHDRRIGATGIVRELLRANAIGLITTHDLALAEMEEDLLGAAVNVHFEDRMEGAHMLFDYKLKPGVVTRSNAIALMRAIGLKV